MQRFYARALRGAPPTLFPLFLLCLAGAWSPTMLMAEDDLSAQAEEAQGALATAADDAKQRASDVTERATRRASEAAAEAKQKGRELASQVGERARALGHEVAEGAKDGLAFLEERASAAVAGGREAAHDAFTKARSEARAVLIALADKLDEKGKVARREARKLRWENLRTRFQLGDERPSRALSEELRDHEYRIARLRRIRELALESDDQEIAARTERSIEAEHARHKRRVEALREEEREMRAK